MVTLYPAGYSIRMKCVYTASNAIEANLLKHLLGQEGIEAYVGGEFLQGAAGELPVNGLARVMVADEDVGRAERVVRLWERGGYALDQ